MPGTVLKKWRSYRDYNLRKMAVIQWIQTSFSTKKYLAEYCSWGTTSYIISQTKVSKCPIPEVPHFILCTPSTRPIHLTASVRDWVSVFKSPLFEVWENKNIQEVPPLRWGFDMDEKVALLQSAREVLTHIIKTQELPPTPSFLNHPRYEEPQGVDIALWTRGHEHGCQIETRGSFRENFMRALWSTAHDPRFRPLSEEELLRTRIEITTFPTLTIPLTAEEWSVSPYTHLGYFALHDQQIISWYLPVVFNVRSFKNFEHFAHSLITEKGSLPSASGAHVYMFPIHNWIESSQSDVFLLSGALPLLQKCTEEDVRLMCERASTWLRAITKDSGYLPSIIHTNHTRPYRLDLVRMLFTALSLATYGKASQNQNLTALAHRIATYAYQLIPTYAHHKDELLARIYYGQYLIVAGNLLEAEKEAEIVLDAPPADDFIQLQLATLLFHLAPNTSSHYRTTSFDITNNLVKIFETHLKKDANIDLAKYAELIALTHLHQHPRHSFVTQWFMRHQHEDGSFCATTQQREPYIRGTSKIIEALSLTTETEATMRGLSFAQQLQYTKNTLYHIDEAAHPLFLGGFRHDKKNKDAWIDAAAHILIAGARILHRPMPSSSENTTLRQR